MQPVFIVGQYKSGTTWLLSALAAHPRAIGLREIDLVRAGSADANGRVELTPRDTRFANFFTGYPYCRAKPNVASEALDAESERAVVLLRGERSAAYDPGRPANFSHLDTAEAASLVTAVREAADPATLVSHFLSVHANLPKDATHLILKAADQIAVFGRLQLMQPDAKKLVIVRDGRDAAISAVHFRKLMKEQGAPWYRAQADYWTHLKGWRNRARMAFDLARSGAVHVIRYEDLTRDFHGTFRSVLEYIGLDAAPELVDTINSATCFEAVTGRRRGEAAAEVVRKGSILEWTQVLDDAEKKEAWKLAGEELAAFGYANSDAIAPLAV